MVLRASIKLRTAAIKKAIVTFSKYICNIINISYFIDRPCLVADEGAKKEVLLEEGVDRAPGVELAIFTCKSIFWSTYFFKVISDSLFLKLGLREPIDSYPKLAIGSVANRRSRVLVVNSV